MTNKRYFTIVLVLIGSMAIAGNPININTNDSTKAFTFTALNMLTINQIAFINWAAGGESSLSSKISTEYDLVYKSDKFDFNHSGNLAFGLVGYIDTRIEKTDDNIDLLWAVSLRNQKKWSLTSVLTFKSQFADGYTYPNDSTLMSTFMAPGYINISLGLNYKPDNRFQLYLSPIAGKLTFVLNQELANKGAYGVNPAVIDTNGIIIQEGENFTSELGVKLLSSYKHQIMRNIDLRTTLNLYNNYTDNVKANRWNIDIDWDTRIVFTINKIFSSVLYFHLKYDHNTLIPKYETVEGIDVIVSSSPKLQLKESFGLSFSYKI